MKPLYNKINEKLFIDTEDISSEINLLPIKKWLQDAFDASIDIDVFTNDILYYEKGNYILNVNDYILFNNGRTIGLEINSIPPENLIIKSAFSFQIDINIKLNKKVCDIINNLFHKIKISSIYINEGGDIDLQLDIAKNIIFNIHNNNIFNIKNIDFKSNNPNINIRFMSHPYNSNQIKGLKQIMNKNVKINISDKSKLFKDLKDKIKITEEYYILYDEKIIDNEYLMLYLNNDVNKIINSIIPEINNIKNHNIKIILAGFQDYLGNVLYAKQKDNHEKNTLNYVGLDFNFVFSKKDNKWYLNIE